MYNDSYLIFFEKFLDMKFMNKTINIGKVFGINLSIHWTFLLILLWAFIRSYKVEQDFAQGLSGVLFICFLFVCVILHELGHSLTARTFKCKTKSIIISPIGGVANMEQIPEKPKQEMLVAIAGPLVNFSIAVILFFYLKFSNQFIDLQEINELEAIEAINIPFQLFIANIVLGVFNLIPAFPMDGGRILRAFLSFKMERVEATKKAAQIGQFFGILFVFIGLLGNPWLAFIGILIFLFAGMESNFEQTKHALSNRNVQEVLMTKFTSFNITDSLNDVIKVTLSGQESSFLVCDNNHVVGTVSRKELLEGLSYFGKDAPVSKIMRKDFLKLNTKMLLSEVYQKFIQQGIEIAPVYLNSKLSGVLDKENVEELLMINASLTSK